MSLNQQSPAIKIETFVDKKNIMKKDKKNFKQNWNSFK